MIAYQNPNHITEIPKESKDLKNYQDLFKEAKNQFQTDNLHVNVLQTLDNLMEYHHPKSNHRIQNIKMYYFPDDVLIDDTILFDNLIVLSKQPLQDYEIKQNMNINVVKFLSQWKNAAQQMPENKTIKTLIDVINESIHNQKILPEYELYDLNMPISIYINSIIFYTHNFQNIIQEINDTNSEPRLFLENKIDNLILKYGEPIEN